MPVYVCPYKFTLWSTGFCARPAPTPLLHAVRRGNFPVRDFNLYLSVKDLCPQHGRPGVGSRCGYVHLLDTILVSVVIPLEIRRVPPKASGGNWVEVSDARSAPLVRGVIVYLERLTGELPPGDPPVEGNLLLNAGFELQGDGWFLRPEDLDHGELARVGLA